MVCQEDHVAAPDQIRVSCISNIKHVWYLRSHGIANEKEGVAYFHSLLQDFTHILICFFLIVGKHDGVSWRRWRSSIFASLLRSGLITRLRLRSRVCGITAVDSFVQPAGCVVLCSGQISQWARSEGLHSSKSGWNCPHVFGLPCLVFFFFWNRLRLCDCLVCGHPQSKTSDIYFLLPQIQRRSHLIYSWPLL